MNGKFDENFFYYFWILLGVVFFSTNVVNIQLGHVFALILTLVILLYIINNNTVILEVDNTTLEGKMNTLLPKNYNFTPQFLYLEPDFILLFDSVKKSLGVQNLTSFYRIIKNTDEILGIKYQLSQNVCQAPTPPDTLIGELNYTKPNCNIDLNSSHCMQSYYTAKRLMYENLNYCNTLILNSRLTQTTEWIYLRFVKRFSHLLKRTVNEIRSMCPQEEEHAEKINFMPINEDPFSTNFDWAFPH